MERNLPHLFIPANRVTTVEIENPYCECKIDEGTWGLEIDEGGILLKHDTCGKSFPIDYFDGLFTAVPIKVMISPDKETCHCYPNSCDCDVSFILRKADQ